jgi:hypothetical protein
MPLGRSLPIAALGGVISALFLLSVLTRSGGGVILEMMSPLPLFGIGLGLGLPFLVLALAVATALVGGLGGLPLGIAYVSAIGLPVLGLMALALKPPTPPSTARLAMGVSAVGVGLFGAAMAAASDTPGGLEGLIRPVLVEAFKWISAARPELMTSAPELIADQLAPWAVGVALSSWLLVLSSNAALANGALGGFGWRRGEMPGLSGIELPRWFGIGWLAVVLAAWLAPGGFGFAARNLTPILALPLLFGGLGLVHALAARSAARQFILVAAYMIVFGLGWPVVLIVALGMMEQWVRLRQRLAAAPRRGEN